MARYTYAVNVPRPLGTAILTGAALIALCLYIRPGLKNPQKLVAPTIRTVTSRTGNRRSSSDFSDKENSEAISSLEHPYPLNHFPGGRDVDTEYGIIRVFEWGDEEGEKVLFLPGIATPCCSMGNIAWELVNNGYRVMLFDFFGRGHSDSPEDLPFDSRLYTTQILLSLSSSPITWINSSSPFHIIGYSLGGCIAASFAAYHPHLLASATLVCPGGILREEHLSLQTRLLFSDQVFNGWLGSRLKGWLLRRRVTPKKGQGADLVGEGKDEDFDFDSVPLYDGKSRGQNSVAGRSTVGDAVSWQLRTNPGFIPSYVSTLRHAPIYGHHEGVWRRLRDVLAERRHPTGEKHLPLGLQRGKIAIVLGRDDPVVPVNEYIEDAQTVLGADAVEITVLDGGHEIALTKASDVASIIMGKERGI